MDYDLFETYIVLCETRNITKTAELLYKTQPAISSRIHQLEESLGFILIQRTKGKKTITLTQKGEEFLSVAKKFIDLYGEIQLKQSELSNSLMISSIDSLSASVSSDICNEMIEKYNTHITLLTYQTPDAYRMIADKKLDVAFVSTSENHTGVTCEPIFQLDYVVVQTCEHPTEEKMITTKDLDPSTEIYQRWNSNFEAWHQTHFGIGNYMVRVDSCATLKHFLENPNSWAVVQRSNLSEISMGKSVQVYTLSDPPPVRICYMITSTYPDRVNVNIIKKFKETVYEYSELHDICP